MAVLDTLTESLVAQHTQHLNETKKRELYQLMEELATLKKGRVFYDMFPDKGELSRDKYAKHMECIRNSALYPENLFLAANRIGKTMLGAYIVVCHATGQYPQWWEGKRFNRPTKIWIGGDTSISVRDIIQEKLLGPPGQFGTGVLPKDTIVNTKTKRNIPDAIETVQVKHVHGGVSTIVFKTYEQGRVLWQGTEIDHIWLDEEPPLEIYAEALIRTMTTKGSLLLTFTPLNGMSDVVTSFLEDKKMGDKATKATVMATWNDAPHLTPEAKAQMLKGIPANQRKCRSEGIPMIGSGLIYPIDDSMFVPDFELPKFWPKFYGMDVGWNVTGVVFGAWDRQNDCVYIYSEHYGTQSEPVVHADAIKRRGGWIKGVVDPASRGRAQADGKALLDIYRDLGLKVTVANNAVESGLYEVWSRLSEGRLKFFNSCTNLKNEIGMYHRDAEGKIVKKNDHCLSGDTKVITNRGIKRIDECLNKPTSLLSYHGDWVDTTGSFKTMKQASLIEVTLDSGYLFKCTPEHLGLNVNGLWYPMCISKGIKLLTLGDVLCKQRLSQANNRNLIWKSIGFVDSITSDIKNDFIEQFGNTTSEKYLALVKSITKIETDQTTKLETLNVLTAENMLLYMRETLLPEGLLALNRTYSEYKMQQKNGIAQLKGEIGTENITKNLSIFFRDEWSESAPYAVNYTKLVGCMERTLSAQVIVDRHLENKMVLTMLQGFVLFVKENLLPINMLKQKLVVELVGECSFQGVEVKTLVSTFPEDVYCFNVPNFESFALENGTIVHNCLDALRYGIMSGLDVASCQVQVVQKKQNVSSLGWT